MGRVAGAEADRHDQVTRVVSRAGRRGERTGGDEHQAVLALGTANPSLAVPGLCSSLHTNLVVVLAVGATNAGGAIDSQMAAASTFVVSNTLAGATIYSQMHALDAGRSDPIKISNSDGKVGTVPLPNLTKLADAVRLWNDNDGTTALQAIVAPATTIGYGLVTQFTY